MRFLKFLVFSTSGSFTNICRFSQIEITKWTKVIGEAKIPKEN